MEKDNMAVKKVTRFETSDDKVFDTEEAAVRHEQELNLGSLLETTIQEPMLIDEILDKIIEKKEDFIKFIESL
jgi:hypothetical protein